MCMILECIVKDHADGGLLFEHLSNCLGPPIDVDSCVDACILMLNELNNTMLDPAFSCIGPSSSSWEHFAEVACKDSTRLKQSGPSLICE